MPIVRIEHTVPDYEVWKRVFDADPADRKGSGVRSYQILQAADDPNFVMIDLEFDTVAEAERFLETMQAIWAGPGKDVMRNPAARIVETVESAKL